MAPTTVDLLAAIPAESRDLARSAIVTALGRVSITALQPVIGGASGALAYRVEAGARSYLLRMEVARTAFRNPHQYTCMRAAADAGIAPPLRYVDPEQGVAVMDFVTQRPLSEYPGGPAALAGDLGGLIRRLQDSPRFPALAGGYLDILDRLLAVVRRSRVFAAGLLDPHYAGFLRLRQAYPWSDAALVSSHNDPNPRNILFDGQRLWLVDWETSYLNDSLTDIAIVSHELAPTPELQQRLLRGWLGREPDLAVRARLVLMRQLTRLYYACLIFSAFGAAPRAEPDSDLKALTPAEIIAAVGQGRLKPGSPEMLYAFGKMFLAGFLDGLTAPGFEEALVVARAG